MTSPARGIITSSDRVCIMENMLAFQPYGVCPTSAAIVPTFSFTSPNIVDRLPLMAPIRISFIHSLIASSMLCISLYPCFLTEQAGKQRYKFRVVLAGFRRIYHFKQRREILFGFRGFIPDIANKGAVKKPFRLHPEILPGFFPVAFGVGDNGIYQFQNILFAAEIGKGIVSHGFLKVNRVQHLYPVPATLQELSALHKHRLFRVGHDIAAVHLHKVGLDEKAGLSATASSNYKDIFVSCILWLLRSAAHHQPFRLGQQYVVCKYRVNVGLYILGIAP